MIIIQSNVTGGRRDGPESQRRDPRGLYLKSSARPVFVPVFVAFIILLATTAAFGKNTVRHLDGTAECCDVAIDGDGNVSTSNCTPGACCPSGTECDRTQMGEELDTTHHDSEIDSDRESDPERPIAQTNDEERVCTDLTSNESYPCSEQTQLDEARDERDEIARLSENMEIIENDGRSDTRTSWCWVSYDCGRFTVRIRYKCGSTVPQAPSWCLEALDRSVEQPDDELDDFRKGEEEETADDGAEEGEEEVRDDRTEEVEEEGRDAIRRKASARARSTQGSRGRR
jgi:hypothetical protein